MKWEDILRMSGPVTSMGGTGQQLIRVAYGKPKPKCDKCKTALLEMCMCKK